MTRPIVKVIITALALLIAEKIVPGIEVESIYIALIVAVVLGLLNLLVRPILLLLTLPITLVTLGLFTFVLNALLFWFTSTFIEGFTVTGFIPAFVGSLLVSFGVFLGEKLFLNKKED